MQRWRVLAISRLVGIRPYVGWHTDSFAQARCNGNLNVVKQASDSVIAFLPSSIETGIDVPHHGRRRIGCQGGRWTRANL